MNNNIYLKKLFQLAWSDMGKHAIDWLFLCGMQFIIILSILLGYVISGLVFIYKIYDIANNVINIVILACCLCIFIISLFVFLLFPIMYRQNALEATFDRPLSGFSINNRFFIYLIVTFLSSLLTLLTLPFLFLGVFLGQRLRFVGLHVLEHGGNIRHAFKVSWNITRGYVLFLIGVSLLQWIILFLASWTLIGIYPGMIFSVLIDTHLYKQLQNQNEDELDTLSCCKD